MDKSFDELVSTCNCGGSGFYTRAEIDEMLANIVDQDTIDAMLDDMFQDYISGTDLEQLIINTLGDVYTQEQIDAMLDDMATMTWVQAQGYLTAQDIAGKLDTTAFTEFSNAMEACCNDVNSYIADLTEKTRHQQRVIDRLYAAVFPTPAYTGVTLVATYNVESTLVPTTILANTSSIVSATYNGNPITIGRTFRFDNEGDNQITFEFYNEQNPIKTPESTFAGVTALKSVEFQSGGLINTNFFKDSGLQSVTLPSALTNIYDSAFEGTPIQTVTIPNSVISIWTSAFKDCTSLSAVTFESGGIGELRILCNAFYGCENLETISFPSRVNKVYCDTFSTDMTSITFEGTTPPELWNKENALGPVSFDFPIYVPASAVNAYKQHIDWDNYKDRVTSA